MSISSIADHTFAVGFPLCWMVVLVCKLRLDVLPLPARTRRVICWIGLWHLGRHCRGVLLLLLCWWGAGGERSRLMRDGKLRD